jgi:hypothetical protein
MKNLENGGRENTILDFVHCLCRRNHCKRKVESIGGNWGEEYLWLEVMGADTGNIYYH